MTPRLNIATTSHVAIALGSNLKDRENYLRAAIAHIAAFPNTQVVNVSRFMETVPVGGPSVLRQGLYLNAAALLATQLEPQDLLKRLLSTEALLGRDRSSGEHHAARTIDLDMLLYEQEIIKSEHLSLPHPRMHERRFVLEPLCEIAPDWVHPTSGKTIRQLFDLFISQALQATTGANPQNNSGTFLKHTQGL